MSNQINDGGPAFPVSDCVYPNGEVQTGSYGMTLRDYFAGQALAGMNIKYDEYTATDTQSVYHAYRIADYMISQKNLRISTL